MRYPAFSQLGLEQEEDGKNKTGEEQEEKKGEEKGKKETNYPQSPVGNRARPERVECWGLRGVFLGGTQHPRSYGEALTPGDDLYNKVVLLEQSC